MATNYNNSMPAQAAAMSSNNEKRDGWTPDFPATANLMQQQQQMAQQFQNLTMQEGPKNRDPGAMVPVASDAKPGYDVPVPPFQQSAQQGQAAGPYFPGAMPPGTPGGATPFSPQQQQQQQQQQPMNPYAMSQTNNPFGSPTMAGMGPGFGGAPFGANPYNNMMMRMQQMQDWFMMQREQEVQQLRAKVEEQTKIIHQRDVKIALLEEKLKNQAEHLKQELYLMRLRSSRTAEPPFASMSSEPDEIPPAIVERPRESSSPVEQIAQQVKMVPTKSTTSPENQAESDEDGAEPEQPQVSVPEAPSRMNGEMKAVPATEKPVIGVAIVNPKEGGSDDGFGKMEETEARPPVKVAPVVEAPPEVKVTPVEIPLEERKVPAAEFEDLVHEDDKPVQDEEPLYEPVFETNPYAEEAAAAAEENEDTDEQDYTIEHTTCENTIASSTFGDDREKVHKKTLLDPYGDSGVYTGIVLQSTGMPHGHGRMKYSEDGRVYEGDWRHGRWHGFGKATFPNGDSYEGGYQFDQRHGHGKYCWRDGRVYDGEFFEDKRHGKGKLAWPDGAVYEGEFLRGQRDGEGKYIFNDGGVYEGGWKGGRYHGFGTCRWSDGRCYQGEWQNGMAHGNGIEMWADGRVRHDGRWFEDEPVVEE